MLLLGTQNERYYCCPPVVERDMFIFLRILSGTAQMYTQAKDIYGRPLTQAGGSAVASGVGYYRQIVVQP